MTRDAAGAWAVIPVKAFAHAKSRLVTLAPARRESLARSFFDRVVDAAVAAPGLAGVAVITSSPDVAERARCKGAAAWPDCDAAGQGRAVTAGIERLRGIGAGAALVLMSDLPGLRVADVEALLALLNHHDVAVAPDRHDEGTNALALSPPDCIPTWFGRADSFARHCAAARSRGLRLAVHRSPALALDVDSPTDLAAWRAGPALTEPARRSPHRHGARGCDGLPAGGPRIG